MTQILHLTASARHGRSLSRMLGARFIDGWRRLRPDDVIVPRDVGAVPPPAISENWIAGAFTPEVERTPEQQDALAISDELIGEVVDCDLIVLATPMYNYGMPAALKAWVDQVVRVNKTFTFDLTRGDDPLAPTLAGKTMVLLTSSGEFGFAPGELRSHMNHLIPHLETVSKYLGVTEIHTASIEYQEFGDARHESSVALAQDRVDGLVGELTKSLPSVAA